MGTQVSILASVEALCRRPDVREVVVALRSDIPQYAAEVLSLPKVVAARRQLRHARKGSVTATLRTAWCSRTSGFRLTAGARSPIALS